jgi:DNA (cytosine-5)-methyltransferase 3A
LNIRKDNKSNCIVSSYPQKLNGWYDGENYRKLFPIECERLQTIPDNYTEGVSNSQRYKMLGNGWTVDVIAHILGYLHC